MSIRTTTSRVKKTYKPNTKGIITIYDRPFVCRYGTFAEFLKIVEAKQKAGYLGKVPWSGMNDSYEKMISGNYHGWTSHWVEYRTSGRDPKVYIEFHTVSHYNDSTGKSVWEKPTAKNDRYFDGYKKYVR